MFINCQVLSSAQPSFRELLTCSTLEVTTWRIIFPMTHDIVHLNPFKVRLTSVANDFGYEGPTFSE